MTFSKSNIKIANKYYDGYEQVTSEINGYLVDNE